MTQVDPVLVAIVGAILLFVFGVFLMIRRTLTAFTEGIREGSRKR